MGMKFRGYHEMFVESTFRGGRRQRVWNVCESCSVLWNESCVFVAQHEPVSASNLWERGSSTEPPMTDRERRRSEKSHWKLQPCQETAMPVTQKQIRLVNGKRLPLEVSCSNAALVPSASGSWAICHVRLCLAQSSEGFLCHLCPHLCRLMSVICLGHPFRPCLHFHHRLHHLHRCPGCDTCTLKLRIPEGGIVAAYI